MKISVELTLSPLEDSFEPHIIAFIKRLRRSGLHIKENPLSTQVYGEYNRVMETLKDEIENVFEDMEHGLLHMKIVKSDLSAYEPGF